MSLASLLSDISQQWVAATNEQFTSHPVASLIRNELVASVKAILNPTQAHYLVKSSPGAGNWADVPWVAILNPQVTKTTQSGIYPVFLFRADGSGVYLSLGFGTTDLRQKYGLADAKKHAQALKESLRLNHKMLETWDANIDLKSTTVLGRSYEWASAGAKFYSVDNFPDDNSLVNDLQEILHIYLETIEKIEALPKVTYVTHTTLSKPFLLLAGISGTGKSRFVRKQAEVQGSEQELYQLVPVRPDWHEPSDLLGYVSRIGGSPRFVVTDALRFIIKAWKATAAQNITLSNGKTGWTGKPLDEIKTYWLCLDEMNLAPVEQYFADYLSVIESRHWLHAEELDTTGKDYVYCCQPIVSASSLNAVNETNRVELASDLGLDIQNNPADLQLWASFLQHGIPVPFNLVVAGTVNMDETTHGFSRKVIDRALTFDFGRFFRNDFQQLWAPETKPKTLQFPRMSHASPDAFVDCEADTDGAKTIQFLQSVNTVLQDTPFELAYRALNELLIAVVCHNPQTEQALQAVWDDFLMCKVLPRIEGDDEKLSGNTGASNISETVLDALIKTLSVSLAQIWDSARPDLFRENINNDEPVLVPCRSKAKLEWMKNRLERNSFTSFWP
jgi:hypothetical protein